MSPLVAQLLDPSAQPAWRGGIVRKIEPQGGSVLTLLPTAKRVTGRMVDAEVSAVARRIREFRDLQDGWMGDGSKAPDIQGLQWLAEYFTERFSSQTPAVFPTPTGEVEMEWRNGDRSACVTVSLHSKMARWFSFYPEDNHDVRDCEVPLELDKMEEWKYLNDLVQGLFSIG